LTALVQLWANHLRPSIEKGRAPHRAMLPSRGVFDRVQGYVIRPLTLPVILREIRFPAFAKQLGLLLPPSRQRKRLFQPGAPSVDKCFRRSPPPYSRLSHRRIGFRRSFAFLTLSRKKARPSSYPRALHPRARRPRAAYRFLQPKRFATTTAETAKPRAPRFWLPKSTTLLRRVTTFLAKRRQPRCYGSGAAFGIARRAPSTLIAQDEGLAPTRSARAPHVVNSQL
jgi:hypothetical protein